MNGVKFGDKHSYDDWGLVLTEKSLGLPEPKTSGIEVEGADGEIDTSEVLSGEIKFSDRTLTFKLTLTDEYEDFNDKVTAIANYLHGKKMRIILDDDALHYYYGRCAINEWMTDRRIGQIAITCKCEPYKYDLNETIITSFINEETKVNVYGKRMTVCPTISVTGNVTLFVGKTRVDLSTGEHEILDCYIREGNNTLTFTGSGSIKLTYRGGEL